MSTSTSKCTKYLLLVFIFLLFVCIFSNSKSRELFNDVFGYRYVAKKQPQVIPQPNTCVNSCIRSVNGEFVILDDCESSCGPFTKDDVRRAVQNYKGQLFI